MRFTGTAIPLESLTRSNLIFDLMQKDFKFSIKDRLVVIPEVAMYRIGEDESIFKQKKEEKYEFQVFFDGEFVCFVESNESKERVRINILKGLARLYKEGKIHWNKFLYEVEKQKAKEKAMKDKQELDKKLEKLNKTPEERIVKDVVKKHLTKNGKSKTLQ